MKIDRDAPIGVFDSGVGGLTVAREIMRNLPSEKIVYFGDTARVPYGSKSKDTVIRYSRQIIHFLEEQQVKAIVIACNTASAFALDAVKDELQEAKLLVQEARRICSEPDGPYLYDEALSSDLLLIRKSAGTGREKRL